MTVGAQVQSNADMCRADESNTGNAMWRERPGQVGQDVDDKGVSFGGIVGGRARVGQLVSLYFKKS